MPRMKKVDPAVLTLQFNLTSSGNNNYVQDTIDLSQCASAINRRFYRQGLNWAVSGFSVLTTSTGNITIQKIPDTWSATNSWTKSMNAWITQQNDIVEESGAESAVARFRDFKVYADNIHAQATSAANLQPVDITGVAVLPGEWEYSQIVIPNFGAPGINYEPFLHMVGDDVGGAGGSKGMIKGYENSRAFPQSPDPVSPDIGNNANWFQSMFDVGDNNEDVLDNATDKNDDLPYDQDNYPGGDANMPFLQIVDESYITASTIGGKTSMRGSTFPCGLIRIRNQSNDATGWTAVPKLLVHLVPGTHRGYMAQPMQEM
jgi:hypothetical protein